MREAKLLAVLLTTFALANCDSSSSSSSFSKSSGPEQASKSVSEVKSASKAPAEFPLRNAVYIAENDVVLFKVLNGAKEEFRSVLSTGITIEVRGDNQNYTTVRPGVERRSYPGNESVVILVPNEDDKAKWAAWLLKIRAERSEYLESLKPQRVLPPGGEARAEEFPLVNVVHLKWRDKLAVIILNGNEHRMAFVPVTGMDVMVREDNTNHTSIRLIDSHPPFHYYRALLLVPEDQDAKEWTAWLTKIRQHLRQSERETLPPQRVKPPQD